MARRPAHCRWGGDCDEPAGHGRFGSFCAEHAAVLAEIRERLEPSRRTTTAAPDPDRDARDLERARKLAEIVRDAGCPVTSLHRRLGLTPQSGDWRRAVALAKARGWIATRQGAGYVPGPAVRSEPSATADTPQDAEREALELARWMAEVVREAEAPVTGLHDRLGLRPHSQEYRRAVEVAKREGWLRLREGVGFEPGETAPTDTLGRQPVAVRAQRLAHVVRAAGGRTVTRAEAAQAVGLSSPTGSMNRVVKHAVEQGWIVSKRGGNGGYAAPAAETASQAA